MKKIYLLLIAILLGSLQIISATTPTKSKKQNSAAVSQIDNSTMDRVGGQAHSPRPVHRLTYPAPNPNFSISSTRGGCLFSDDFDGTNDTTSLKSRGYKVYYRGGGAQGIAPIWFQGNPIVFSAFNGPANGYVGSNFNSVTGANDIDNWLVLPSMNLATGDVVSFFSRSVLGSTFADTIKVMYSSAGDSLPEALTWALLGEFQVNTFGTWDYKSFVIPAPGATGRIAIRYAVVDGGPGGANSNFIGIDRLAVYNPIPQDGDLTSFIAPTTGCALTNAEAVTIEINNRGTSQLSGFDVTYTADAGSPVTENVTDTIAPGGTFSYTFTAHADLSAVGMHTISAGLLITNDSNSCNDNGSIVIQSFPLTAPLTTAYTMGFESNELFAAMAVEDLDGDQVSWDTTNIDPHTGLNSAIKDESFAPDDDWLFTGCLDLVAGSTYTMDYWYKTDGVTFQSELETYIGNDQTAVAMGQLINNDPLPLDDTYHHSISTFSVQNSGTYYIGIRSFTNDPDGSLPIFLDDINIDDGTSIGIAEPSVVHDVKVFPNPSDEVFYLHSKRSANNIKVEVFNIGGQLVYTTKLNDFNDQRIDLSDQAEGVYNLRITTDSFVENHSIVISR